MFFYINNIIYIIVLKKYDYICINDCIYFQLRDKDGFMMNKLLKVKVDGILYNKIKEMHGGELPRYLTIIKR